MTLKNINDHSIDEVCTHVVLNEILDDKIKNVFIKFRVLIDFNAFDEIFIDKIFAQNLNLELIFMKFFKILKIFDESAAACDSIIHYVDVYFKVFVALENVRLIRFYVIELFHWLVVFEVSWFMKNKINISFEKMIVEIFIATEQSAFDISVFFEKNTKQAVNAFKKYEFVFMIFINENDSLIDVNVISVAAFSRLIKKKNHSFEVFSLKNIEKTFNIKSKSNSATMIWKKMKRHLFLFQLKKVDKLFSHRFYNYKIELLLNKKSGWSSLYDMFKDELLMLQKYFKKNLSKKFIRFSFFEYSSSVFFVKKFEKDLRFCVNYRKLNAIIKKNRYFMFFV